MSPDLDSLREMRAAFKQAAKEGVVDGQVYRDMVLTSLSVRALFGLCGALGLVATTFFAFFFGPKVGALMTILCGSTSIFLPQILSERVQKRLYRRAIRTHVLIESTAATTSFAIPSTFKHASPTDP